MATRRTIIRNVLRLIGILAVAAVTGLWRVFRPLPDEKVHVTEAALAKLAELGARPKYVDEPGTIYNGMRPEHVRLTAQAQLNDLIQRLSSGLQEKPSKRFVLEEFSRTLAQFEPWDTEDRERVCRYLMEIMDILGIESSDGVLNRWLYGWLLGTLTSQGRLSE
ncbi:MAG: DUF4844 domain-containing protein [Hyphomicrobiales bacterium]